MKQKITLIILPLILVITWLSCKKSNNDSNLGALLLLGSNQGDTSTTLPTGSGSSSGGGSGSGSGGGSGSFTIGGTVNGLTGNIQITLTSGSITENKTINSNGPYSFTNTISGNYSVTISNHSVTSFCYFPNANAQNNAAQTGNANSNVTNVNIQCVGRLTLNEICSNSCTGSPGNADFIELKNISGGPITIQSGTSCEWWVCDKSGSSTCETSLNTSVLESSPPTNLKCFNYQSSSVTVNANGYITNYDSGSQMFGLSNNDGVYLLYKAGSKFYLVEQYPGDGLTFGNTHVQPARKSPDGAFVSPYNYSIWTTTGSITYGSANL